jgi:Transcription factor WhiB
MQAQQRLIEPEYHKVQEVKEITVRGKLMKAFKLKWNPKLTEQAICKGIDTELFYPDKNIFTPQEEKVFASMCIECPVMMMCLEWGLAHEKAGIWGGTTPHRRAGERSQRGWVATDPRTGLQYARLLD